MANNTGGRYTNVLASRRTLGGVAGLLGIGLIALAIMAAVGFNGTKTQKLKVIDCTANDTTCQPRQATHFHADFALFIDGKEFNFNQPQFVSPDDDLVAADVHIHPDRYTVVHVHYTNTTWARFFQSLGFQFQDQSMEGVTPEQTCLTMPSGEKLCNSASKTFKFYVNGVQVKGIAGTNIADLDRVLISYGSETPAQVEQTQLTKVTDQACIPDERCKDRIPPNEPPETCSISNSTGCTVLGS
jgi:hypothetical protein